MQQDLLIKLLKNKLTKFNDQVKNNGKNGKNVTEGGAKRPQSALTKEPENPDATPKKPKLTVNGDSNNHYHRPGRKKCPFFMRQGRKCKYGQKCRLFHPPGEENTWKNNTLEQKKHVVMMQTRIEKAKKAEMERENAMKAVEFSAPPPHEVKSITDSDDDYDEGRWISHKEWAEMCKKVRPKSPE